jgi:spore maturation protein A
LPEATAPPTPLQQTGKDLTGAALDAAELSIQLCLTLAGVMILWLGILQVASDAGMVDALARALRPLMRWLFPDVPDGHPAQGAMLMNISANMLGLDNAATPFGIKAMKELQELNPHKESASNAMATFLAVNTSSVTLVPISVIALRAAAGSESPAAPLGGILIATTLSTIAAIIAVRWLSKLPRFAVEPDSGPSNELPAAEDGSAT